MMCCFSLSPVLRRLLCLLFLLAVPATMAAAQGSNDGSLYSRFGLGELHSFASPQIQALGGGGTGLLSFNYVNFQNPASWSDQVLTRVAAGMQVQRLQVTDSTDVTSRLSQGTLNAVQFSFPLLSRQLGLGISFAPYSRVSHSFQVGGRLDAAPSTSDTTSYDVIYAGSGGLQQISAGLGYRLSRYVSFGASVDFVFGVLENIRRTEFPAGTSYTNTSVTTSTRLYGATGTIGTLIAVPRLLSERDLFSVGAAITLPTSLQGNRVRTLGDPQDPRSVERDTLGVATSGSVHLPFSAQLGATYQPDNRWMLVVDGLYEPWTQFESDFAFGGYEPEETNLFRDRLRGSAGIEFLPAGSDLLAPYLKRVAYRIGGYYDRSYVAPAADVELRTIALTSGLSLPTLFPGTHLDITFEVGTRGATELNLVRDMFYRLSANINFGERWFEQRKLR